MSSYVYGLNGRRTWRGIDNNRFSLSLCGGQSMTEKIPGLFIPGLDQEEDCPNCDETSDSPQHITEEQGVHEQWNKDAKEVTLETLPEFIRHLLEDYHHDYGTKCRAVAVGAIAAAEAMNSEMKLSVFQTGFVMWEFMRQWMGWTDEPLRIIQYKNMLNPSYENDFDKVIPGHVADYLKEEATKKLNETATLKANGRDPGVGEAILTHWEKLAAGEIPFGYKVLQHEQPEPK